MSHPIPRWFTAVSLALAPALGLVAACATPGLHSTTRGELVTISAHPERFHVYAVAILLSSYLMVPAFFGLMTLLRTRRPRWGPHAGGLAQVGKIVAGGDAATELMYWKMGSPGADLGQMVALSERYDTGSAWVYGIGGLAFVLGSILVAVGLWRTRVLPRWAAAGVGVSSVLNVVGFASANQPVLIASYVVMLAALARAAVATLDEAAEVPSKATRSVLTAGSR
jgi:hypothetical protein